MSDLHRLLEESVSEVRALRAEGIEARRELADLTETVASLAAALRELLAAREVERDILQRILEACTADSGHELHEAISALAAAISALGIDVRAILVAVGRPPPASA